MIMLKSQTEIEKIRRSGEIVASVLATLRERIEPGVSTQQLNDWAEVVISRFDGGRPAFKGYAGFPACLCTSVNEEVVHGIPSSKRVLQDGDIVSLDVGVQLDDFYADAAATIPVGDVRPETARLLDVSYRALHAGIREARVSSRVGDISSAIQGLVESEGYSVVREYVGHGVGIHLHEDPQIPNWGESGRGVTLEEGLVIAIEPMVNQGESGVDVMADNWTVVTRDHQPSAHFEHTVAITADGPLILTPWEDLLPDQG